MTLSDALRRDNNNFDLLRLVAAGMVIIGHSHALVPVESSRDLVLTLLEFDYSGSLAVKFFFFLSGLLVTNSLIEKPQVVAFAMSRFCRVMPGLIVCVLLSALVLGPMVTSLSPPSYFSDHRTWSYIRANILLIPQWDLPGVFTDHRNPGVNGSLWTLPFEVLCYVVLAALGLCGALRHRLIASALMVFITFYAILTYAVTVHGLSVPVQLPVLMFRGLEARLLPACFAFGALLAINKDAVQARVWILAGLIVLCALCRGSGLFQFVFYAALFHGSILAATTSALKRVHLLGDFSYGVYVYGFPLQQLMVSLWPRWSVRENQAAALAAALIMGAASWYLIERPAIRTGRRLSAWGARFGVAVLGAKPVPVLAGVHSRGRDTSD
jgi:peptidoglycan/LPS O-acetylase OafA/YrhL